MGRSVTTSVSYKTAVALISTQQPSQEVSHGPPSPEAHGKGRTLGYLVNLAKQTRHKATQRVFEILLNLPPAEARVHSLTSLLRGSTPA